MLADKASRKDFNPKHRIVGAIVLVSLAVIFVPMLLDKHEAPAVSPAVAQLTQIPDQNQVMVADVAPLTAPASAATETPKSNTVTAAAPADKPKVVAAAPTPSVPASMAPAAAPAATPVIPVAAHPGKGWFVQVGTFAQSHNAEQVAHKLRTHGYPVYLEQVALSEGYAVRVRVGPYQNKDQARHTQSEILRKAGVRGDVRAE